MNNFPKGNDLIVKWAIKYSDGTPFPLENYAWELCYSAGRGINVVKDTAVISASDNLLTWRFSGKDQAFYGKYSLTLRLYQQGKIVATVSKNNAFELSTTQYDGACDIDLVSYCDNISLQDALLRGNRAMEVAQGAKDIAGSAVNTAGGAVTTANEAKAIASTANNTSTEAKTIANNAKTVADQAKITADATAATATQKAEEVAQKEAQLEATLNNLSTDQSGALALSTKVNEHGEKLSKLDMQINGKEIEQPNIRYDGSYSSGGSYTASSTNGYCIVDVRYHRGKKITSSTVIQWGFLKTWEHTVGITYCEGTTRQTGTPVEQTIPLDCNYLYLYIGTDTSLPYVVVEDDMNGIAIRVDGIENELGGITEIEKSLVWADGYITSSGGVRNSSASKFSQPFMLRKGETLKVGTLNTNITLVGTTDKVTLVAYDTITPIRVTSSSAIFTNYEYTAENDIRIVVCVLKDNYTLSFEKNVRRLDELEDKVSNLKSCIAIYEVKEETSNDDSHEQLSIYIPSTIGYVRYAFGHSINQSKNADSWRILRAVSCDDSFVERFPITTYGEWEMALKLNNAPDFIGGVLHGDEIVDSIVVYVDGLKKNMTSINSFTNFEELRVVEITSLYNPSTPTEKVARHYKEYIFTKDGIELNQQVIWLMSKELTTSYMCMFPMLRGNDTASSLQVSSKYYDDNTYEVCDISIGGLSTYPFGTWHNGVSKVQMYAEESGVFAQVELISQPSLTGGNMAWMQNTINQYNKHYFSICGIGNTYTTQVNERWKVRTKYSINVNSGLDL